MTGFTILIIEDETKIRELIAKYLERESFAVLSAGDGLKGLNLLRDETIDLLVLDLNLPTLSGETILEELRRFSDIPVIILTAKGDEMARVQGFVLGADDYMIKPFSMTELMERIKAVIRRVYRDRLTMGAPIIYGDLTFDDRLKQVEKAGVPVELTANEYKLLSAMAHRPGQVFTRDQLAEQVFGMDYEAQSRNVDTYIKNIRKKLMEDPKRPKYIITRFGLGYQFGGGDDAV